PGYAAAGHSGTGMFDPHSMPSPPDDDTTLLAALRRGDDAAFETLVRTHASRMLAATRRILHNEDDAREALQDAYISVFRHIGGFTGGSRLSTWLHRIAVNAALMKLRSRKSIREKPI